MIFKGLIWVMETIYEAAENELFNIEEIQKKLIRLQTMYELEEISREDYEAAKEILMDRLKKAIERNKELEENSTMED